MSIININKFKQRGFTIVELLIVIVVIAILAAISIVAYNGIQTRARDAKRESAISTITKALEMYHIDNGGYPDCSGGTYRAGGARTSCTSANPNVLAALSPKYISEVPQDPKGNAETFRYMAGSRKTNDVSYAADASDNYLLVVAYEGRGGPYVLNWGAPYNYFAGSSN